MTYDLRSTASVSASTASSNDYPNTYVLTPEGVRVTILYTKVHNRLQRSLIAAGYQPPAPLCLRHAPTTIDKVISNYTDKARLQLAA